MITRRSFLATSAAMALPLPGLAATPALTVASRQLEVLGRAATVYGISNAAGGNGLVMAEGERFQGRVLNQSGGDLILHWHGQTLAPATMDRTRPGGGVQADGSEDDYDFLLTPGTHWIHSHQLTEQQLLAAPMVTREADAAGPETTIMLHDFAFRSPEEILTELRASKMHDMADMGSMAMDGMAMDGAAMDSMAMPAMVHANDVTYDAYLANDRTLADPQVIEVEPGPFRLRLINGATATGFWLDTGLPTRIVATDGVKCRPTEVQRVPIAQGQRVDLIVTIPAAGGAFPILAQVEASRARTGVILATNGAQVAKVAGMAEAASDNLDLSLDAGLAAAQPVADRPGQMQHVLLGMHPDYRWTINDGTPLVAALGSRMELMFMNPTMMMHPMHLHGHHFQVVDVGKGRFAGPMRDTVIVPPGAMVTVAVDLDKPGDWFLHCHHLYHMAGGMMTSVNVA
ncbi:MAG: multicopper oxidase domain-containing protein [bacterium]